MVFGRAIKKPWKTFSGPQPDKIYKVESTGIWTIKNEPVILLQEFPDNWYSASAFRKVDEAFAEAVLENVKEQIKEDQLVKI